jgi:isopentenyl phosphate kinase
MAKIKKVLPIKTAKTAEEKLQDAVQILQEEKIRREQLAMNELNDFIAKLQEKYGVRVTISQPQLIVSA